MLGRDRLTERSGACKENVIANDHALWLLTFAKHTLHTHVDGSERPSLPSNKFSVPMRAALLSFSPPSGIPRVCHPSESPDGTESEVQSDSPRMLQPLPAWHSGVRCLLRARRSAWFFPQECDGVPSTPVVENLFPQVREAAASLRDFPGERVLGRTLANARPQGGHPEIVFSILPASPSRSPKATPAARAHYQQFAMECRANRCGCGSVGSCSRMEYFESSRSHNLAQHKASHWRDPSLGSPPT